MSGKLKAYQFAWRCLDLIFPPTCAGCGKAGYVWCDDCQTKIKKMTGFICEICGIMQSSAGVCNVCANERPYYEKLRSWAVFDFPVRNALHQLKYRRNVSLGCSLAVQMLEFVQQLGWKFDFVAPIPLGKSRLRERGYNQSALIAYPLSLGVNIHYRSNILARQRETKSQVGLSRIERKENIRDAFISLSAVAGKSVLLFDDVATTGSTLSSAAKTLLDGGANRVYALTVARALTHQIAHA